LVVAADRCLDETVRTVCGIEDLARVVQAEWAQIDGDVVLVRRREPDLGDVGPGF
jgi:hypothetical protein